MDDVRQLLFSELMEDDCIEFISSDDDDEETDIMVNVTHMLTMQGQIRMDRSGIQNYCEEVTQGKIIITAINY